VKRLYKAQVAVFEGTFFESAIFESGFIELAGIKRTLVELIVNEIGNLFNV
jgi:hypothetical protein